jgi:hypothetical protein
MFARKVCSFYRALSHPQHTAFCREVYLLSALLILLWGRCRDYNWYSVPKQVDSVRILLNYDFLYVLPGHGRPRRMRDAAHRLQLINDLLEHEGAL